MLISQCAYKVVWLTKETDETEDWLLLYKYSENYIFDDSLLEEIKANLEKSDIEAVLLNYGFYHTNYGLGIFVLFAGTYEMNAINKMRAFLESQHFTFSNEFSDKRWVYRFKLNLLKDLHLSILKKFHSSINS